MYTFPVWVWQCVYIMCHQGLGVILPVNIISLTESHVEWRGRKDYGMILFIPVQIMFDFWKKKSPNPVKVTIKHYKTLQYLSGKHQKNTPSPLAQRRHLPFYLFEIKEFIFSVGIKLYFLYLKN